ncbi:hypothetical protein M0804_013059 [Polistes exclamans]|nr:hypothetical protein M0804_013059 [Polistes exclamans]
MMLPGRLRYALPGSGRFVGKRKKEKKKEEEEVTWPMRNNSQGRLELLMSRRFDTVAATGRHRGQRGECGQYGASSNAQGEDTDAPGICRTPRMVVVVVMMVVMVVIPVIGDDHVWSSYEPT